MKKLIQSIVVSILMSVILPESTAAQDYINGSYFEKGKTVEVDKTIHEITPTNTSEILYFSNDLIVKVNTNADLLINSFGQQLDNTNKWPSKLKSKTHNFAATLNKGTIIFTYSGGDENSSCTISTPYTDHEFQKGTYYVQVTDSKVIVFALDGSVRTTGGNHNIATTPSGYAVIGSPNDVGILDTKVTLYTDKVKPAVIEKLNQEVKDVTNIEGSVMFIRMDGKTTGVVIN